MNIENENNQDYLKEEYSILWNIDLDEGSFGKINRRKKREISQQKKREKRERRNNRY